MPNAQRLGRHDTFLLSRPRFIGRKEPSHEKSSVAGRSVRGVLFVGPRFRGWVRNVFRRSAFDRLLGGIDVGHDRGALRPWSWMHLRALWARGTDDHPAACSWTSDGDHSASWTSAGSDSASLSAILHAVLRAFVSSPFGPRRFRFSNPAIRLPHSVVIQGPANADQE